MSKSSPIDRRTFLKRGVQACVLATGAGATSLAMSSCDSAPTASTTTSTTTTPKVPTPLTSKDWRRLGDALIGTLVLPFDPSYATDRLLYNSKFTNPHPAGIAYCESPDDVARCIDFVNRHGIEVTARSGGHSYGGYSSCPGLVIDVSRFNAIEVDTRANTAFIGAGARMIDVYNEVGARDRVLPGGSCPTLGIAGLTLGGGVGVFARKFGLTCDNLRGATVVGSSGERLTVDSSSHSELLWALRGGGGGNFAVATSFTFDVHPMPPVTLFTLQYPWAAASDVLEGWQHWISMMPDELWSGCQLYSQGTYGFLAQVTGVYCGSASALTGLLAQLDTTIGTPPTSSFVSTDAYMNAMMSEAGCSRLSVASCHLPTTNPAGVLSREAYGAKSSYLNAPTNSSHATAFVQAIEHMQSLAPTLGGALAFDAYGGAVNRIDKSDTAFVHRDKLACIQATSSWSSYASTSQIAAGQQWLSWLGSDVFVAANGAYQNYIDPTLSDWQSAYYGTNLDRLIKVKRKFDPDNVFRFAQSIPTHT